jgi:hypothetical protein
MKTVKKLKGKGKDSGHIKLKSKNLDGKQNSLNKQLNTMTKKRS